MVKEQEAGAKTADVCRKHGISDATFYKWKARYGGLEVSEARRLKALEDENARLKRLLADAKRRAVHLILEKLNLSERRACDIVGVARRVVRHEPVRSDDGALRKRLRELAAERRRFGYRRLGYLLAREGLAPNHKKLLRVYREEGLKVRRRGGRKRALGV